MDILLTADQVAEAYEGDIPEERMGWVEQKIGETYRLLAGRCPVARRRVEADPADALVADVVTRAVLRLVRDDTPLYKSESEDGYSYTKNSLVASGDIWFPDSDLAALGCGGGGGFGVSRVRPDRLFASPRRRGGWW